MKRFRILLAVFMCSALLLSACGSGGSSSNQASDSSTDTEKKLDPYKITLVYPGTAPKDLELVQNEMSKYLTEKINATIELKPIEWGSWTDKTNLMKISNEKFDLLFTANWFNYANDVSKGQFLELDELMKEHGKDIPDILGPDFLQGAKINGKLYALPTKKEFGQGFGLLLNKKLVDKYNIDTSGVKSFDELEAMFKLIKEKEPNVIPIVSSKYTNTFSAANYDGITTNLALPRGSKEIKIVDTLEDSTMVDYYKRIRQWNLNGWFDKDVLTSDADQAVQMIKAGKAFAVGQSLKPGKDKEMSVTYGTEFVQVETFEPFTTTGEAQGAMLGISRTSKDPARVMMFLNLLYSDKQLINMLDWGIEGVHYVKKSDNVIDYPDGVTADTQSYPNPGSWMFGNQFNSYLWSNEDPEKWVQFEEFNTRSERSPILGFTFNPEPVKSELAALDNVSKEFSQGLNSGSVDVDKALADWKEKRAAAGFDRVKAEAEKQLQEWLASQKQ
ncbi:ABC transporter substrate-binding protein [Paenibacillus aquistagni]|uniref:ABC transporter substrate-binding protein n=1 Tax=Paenibacillus aquistagni TaxID=1852522 RepID=UPI000B50D4EC|nr:ABC transporter substrate-binding protein [Paenibacillus aquistagni]